MKSNLKEKRQGQWLAVLVATCALLAGAQAFAQEKSKETSITELRLIEDKFRSLNLKDEKATFALIGTASEAVAGLGKADKKLDAVQVRELVEVLRVSAKADTHNRIADDNIDLIKGNMKAIQLEIKKLPPKEAKTLKETLAIVLASYELNDEGPGPQPKK